VVEHTQEIIYGAFQWTEGQYRLEEGGDTKESIKLNISTPDVIVEAAKPPVGAGGPPLTLDTARDLKDDPQLQRAIEILRASTALRVRLRQGQ